MFINSPGRFIGNREVEPFRSQSNATEVDNPKTWVAHSLLWVQAERQHHGLPIRCVAIHPASLTPQSTEMRLDINCTCNRSLLELMKQIKIISIKFINILKYQTVIKETCRKVGKHISFGKVEVEEKVHFVFVTILLLLIRKIYLRKPS